MVQAGRCEVAQVKSGRRKSVDRVIGIVRHVQISFCIEFQALGRRQARGGEIAQVDAGRRKFANRVVGVIGDIEVPGRIKRKVLAPRFVRETELGLYKLNPTEKNSGCLLGFRAKRRHWGTLANGARGEEPF